MKSFVQYLKDELDEEMPKGNVDANWFINRGLPMVVECKCCQMTMALPNAFIDEEGYTYCSGCAGGDLE